MKGRLRPAFLARALAVMMLLRLPAAGSPTAVLILQATSARARGIAAGFAGRFALGCRLLCQVNHDVRGRAAVRQFIGHKAHGYVNM